MAWMLLCLALTLLFFYTKAPLSLWLFSFAIIYVCIAMLQSSIAMALLTIIGLLLGLLLVTPFRHYCLKRFMGDLQASLPKISSTEREALEASSPGWEQQILMGSPKWRSLHAIQWPQLSKAEQEFMQGPLAQLLEQLDNWEIAQVNADLPATVWQFLKEKQFFGIMIPLEYGGLGFSNWALAQILSQLYAKNVAIGTTVAVPNSLGPAELLLEYGTPEQKQQYLPRLASGKDLPCFALTSLYAGSDATSMYDYGVVKYAEFDNERVLGMELTWDKRYITMAPVATLIGLAFKLYDPDGLLGKQAELGITCALVPAKLPGISIGKRHNPLHAAFQNGPIAGDKVFIPLTYIIGGPVMAGKGWRMLMECLAAGRAIALPASAHGQAQQILAATSAYSSVREQFGIPIKRFEGIQEVLARMTANTYLVDALFKFTVSKINDGSKAATASAISKYHATEIARKIINDAMDIHGGKGICIGPNNYLFEAYQSTPIGITVEGANILTRSLIIFGQGVIRSHPYVLKELEAISQGNHQALDKLLLKHIQKCLYNFARSLVYALSAGFFIKAPAKKLKKYYKRMSKYSIFLAFFVDVILLCYRGHLKKKESLSGRMADIISKIYLASAVMHKFYQDKQPASARAAVVWCLEDLSYQIEQSFIASINNLPSKFLQNALMWLLFPYGAFAKLPTDKLHAKISTMITTNSALRQDLTQHANMQTPALANLTKLFTLVQANQNLLKRYKKLLKKSQLTPGFPVAIIKQVRAKGWLTAAEEQILLDLEQLKSKVLAVDAFTNQELSNNNYENQILP